MNKRGDKPESLTNGNAANEPQRPIDLVEQESLTRFDKRKSNNNRKKKKKPIGNREVAETNEGNNIPNEQPVAAPEKKGQERNNKQHPQNKKEDRPQRERENRNRNHNRNNRQNGAPNNRQRDNKEPQKEKQLPPANE
jgi:hypothetical protein